MKIQLIFLGLFLTAIVFAGCITWESADNLSNQNRSHSPDLSSTSFIPTTETPAFPSVIIHGTETPEKWGNLTGLSSSTAYFDYGENASIELSHGPVTIQQNDTSDSGQSYLVKTNITLKNTGLVPIEVVYGTVVLKDDVGDGCVYNLTFTCGIIGFGTESNDGYFWLEPGKYETKPLKTIIVSPKSIEYLSSQKFYHQGLVAVQWKSPDGRVNGDHGQRSEWLIELNPT